MGSSVNTLTFVSAVVPAPLDAVWTVKLGVAGAMVWLQSRADSKCPQFTEVPVAHRLLRNVLDVRLVPL